MNLPESNGSSLEKEVSKSTKPLLASECLTTSRCMPYASTYRIRKIYRGLARIRGSGSLPQLTLFVRRESVARLLEFLGYRQQE